LGIGNRAQSPIPNPQYNDINNKNDFKILKIKKKIILKIFK